MRKSRQQGIVEQVAPDAWRVRFRIDGHVRTVDTFPTEAEAEVARVGTAQMIARGHVDVNNVKTLAEYGFAVIDDRELGKLTTDTENERSRWRTHVAGDVLGKLDVGEPVDLDVKDWLRRLAGKGLKRQTRIHCLNLARAVFADAIDRKKHPGPNPCVGSDGKALPIKKEKRTEEPWTFLLPEEQDALISATLAPLDAIVEFAIGSGLRGGELVSLRLADVHVDDAEPHVLVRYGGPPAEPTKGGKPRRVELFGRSLGAMRRWLAALPGYAASNPHRLAFPAARGGFRSHDHVLRWAMWKGAPAKGKPGERNYHAPQVGIVERAGIVDRNVRWHDLRHTCASSLICGWWGRQWTIAEVQSVLGHSSPSTTERYAHLADTVQRKAARETIAALALIHSRSRGGDSEMLSLADSSMISLGAGHRDRTGALRLGNAKHNPSHSKAWVANGSNLGSLSADFLSAAAAGDSDRARTLALQLASSFMAQRDVALASQVLAGGPHALGAAIELAERLTALAPADEQETGS